MVRGLFKIYFIASYKSSFRQFADTTPAKIILRKKNVT